MLNKDEEIIKKKPNKEQNKTKKEKKVYVSCPLP